MTYSSGIFYEETNNLSEAQENKYQSILDMLNLKKEQEYLRLDAAGEVLRICWEKGF